MLNVLESGQWTPLQRPNLLNPFSDIQVVSVK